MARPRPAANRSRFAPPATSFDLVFGRVVVVLLLAIPLVTFWILFNGVLRADPGPPSSSLSRQVSALNPLGLLGTDERQRFLPSPVAAIPPEQNAGPPVPAAVEQAPVAPGTTERVKVANTGGIGANLRAEPPRGRTVAALREGQLLEVLERRQVGDAEWLRVRTEQGVEGWVFGRLVGPAG